jgi:hypothetical protein
VNESECERKRSEQEYTSSDFRVQFGDRPTKMGYEIALHAPQDYRRSVFRVYATSVTDSFPVLLIFKIRSQGIEALTEILEIP